MADTDRRVGVFFSTLTAWREELDALRALLLDSGLKEEFKWRSPVYTVDGGNVAILWGFKDRATLGFFKGVLLKDPARLLVAPGANSRSSRVVNFTSLKEIRQRRAVLKDYLREAIGIERAGLTVDFPKDDLSYPEELVRKLEDDAAFREAFEALTPGRRRSWVLHISQAKKSETRSSRIESAAPAVFEGKGLNDR